MTTNLRSTISAQLGWTWRDHVGEAVIVDSNRLLFSKDLADGAGTNQSDAVWHADNQSLAAGQSRTLALDMLPQTLFGDTVLIRLVQIKAIHIVNRSVSGGYLLVGGAAAGAWHAPFGSPGDTVKVMPDSPLLVASARDGWSVGSGNSLLKITAVGDAVTYDVAVLGVLAASGGSSSSSAGI